MRRFLSLFTMLMLCGVLAFAQSRVVTGKVTDESGNPVAFASITVKGTKTGTIADANGAYSIKVTPNTILVISGASFKDIEVPVGTQSVLNTVMEKAGTDIKEVVVTSAFGTKRAKRATASGTQNVDGEAMNVIRQGNVNDALSGKVAGLQVKSQSAGKLGAENTVRLRGENSLNVGGGALYVVDGTIMSAINNSPTGAFVTNNGSSSADINPDDIEDITILQGPAAAALFGPDGSNGAIVINTKKAKKSQRGVGLEINSGVQWDNAYILPDFQNSYAGGNDPVLHQFNYVAGFHPAGWAALNGKYYPDYQEDVSWGPRLAGQEYIPWYAWYKGHERSFKTANLTPQPTNAKDYFETGVRKINNINFSKAGEGFAVRVSYTNSNQTGIVPNTYLKKNTFNVNTSIELSRRFTVAANINYVNDVSNSANDDTYSNNSSGSFNQWFHRELDMDIMRELRYLKTDEGVLATWNHGNPGLYSPTNPNAFYRNYYWFSPFSYQDNISYLTKRNHIYGDASLTYKATNDLSFKFTYRKDMFNINGEVKMFKALETSVAANPLAGFNIWENAGGRAATFQGFELNDLRSDKQNYEGLISYSKKYKSFALNANAGFDIVKFSRNRKRWNSTGGLLVADEFLPNNSKTAPVFTNNYTNTGRRSVFVRADLGYKNFAFVEGTFRRDYSSTEQQGYSIDTKSVGVSFVFSDLINKGRTSFLSYGKLRGSIGQLLNTLTAYQNTVLYDPTVFPVLYGGNTRLITEPNTLVNPTIHGSTNTEKELGLELRFLKNRIGISGTYWDRTNKDFPFNVDIYGGSGYTTLATNAGEIKKKGIDLQAFIIPVRMKKLEWTISGSYGKLIDNKVVSIAPGITRTTAISNGQGGGNVFSVNEVGQQWGQLIGKAMLRDENGTPVLGAAGGASQGLFVVDPVLKNFGNALPDFTGGIQNSITLFKNFIINVNIDFQKGGKFFSLSKYYGNASGLYQETAVLNDKGNAIRDDVSNGGGVHVFGVDQVSKAPVDYYINARAYFEQFPYGGGIVEPYIKDLTFVKLRELSIGYKLPVDRMGLGKVLQSGTVSFTARNPWLIYSKARGFDPSEISPTYGEEGQLPGTRSLGINLRLGF
jgi:TonB-linked SusC/RagA family outer membrane protein